MASDWKRWCRDAGHRVDGDDVTVEFAASGRHHRVAVSESADEFEFRAIAVKSGSIRVDDSLVAKLWSRNRGLHLVGIAIEDEDRIVVRAHLPVIGLTAAEFTLLVQRVAAEADRVEYILTGKDAQ